VITVAQAFHWFNPSAFRKECERIMTPGGWVLLIWNDRKTSEFPFLINLESLIERYGIDYKQVSQRWQDKNRIIQFYSPEKFHIEKFTYSQILDFEGLKGRILSASYMPQETHSSYAQMISDLKKLFDQFQIEGHVRIEYDTTLYFGQLQNEKK
jgi:hypothetical protein